MCGAVYQRTRVTQHIHSSLCSHCSVLREALCMLLTSWHVSQLAKSMHGAKNAQLTPLCVALLLLLLVVLHSVLTDLHHSRR